MRSDVAGTIGDHAVIGDGRSAALVTRAGVVDWLCWPRVDSPACLARLLDREGGAFSIALVGGACSGRRYLPETNVLETRLVAPGASVVVLDFMTCPEGAGARATHPERALVRIARCERGEAELDVVCDPRPGFGLARRHWSNRGAFGHQLEARGEAWTFRSAPRLSRGDDGAVRGRVRLRGGESASFSLGHATEAPGAPPPAGDAAEEALRRTVRVWRRWASGMVYDGPFREAVLRSALALKLLAYAPSGAIVAAATTSLPERVGGDLNWDYRFCWLRDASLTARALFGLGFHAEAEAFVTWLLHSTRLTRPALHVLYDVYGRPPPVERDLPLEGYRGSRPVRAGNAARAQLQLDVYGEVVDAATQLVRRGVGLDRETGRLLAALGAYVCDHWREPDEGLWEPRGPRQHHTHSKVLCWTALDRLLELHARGHLVRADADRFAQERAAIRREVDARGWSEPLQSYTQVFGGTDVDAALLQLAWYGYLPASSPRMRWTAARIDRELSAAHGRLYRYRAPPGWREGAFGICGFWAAEHLALGGGTADAAHSRIACLLRDANDVGLFAEEVDPATGEALGNFPQAFTHIGLVNACLTLQQRLTGQPSLEHQRGLPDASDVEPSGPLHREAAEASP
ncbi:MAG: glycoside hydrolase family 15 protein [Anaeromyxobacteraceae bacterium]